MYDLLGVIRMRIHKSKIKNVDHILDILLHGQWSILLRDTVEFAPRYYNQLEISTLSAKRLSQFSTEGVHVTDFKQHSLMPCTKLLTESF